MKFAAMFVALIGFVLVCTNRATAQQSIPANTEFITSSSPLPDGSVVTTTYFPKSGAAPETKWSTNAGQADTAPSVSSGRPALEQSVLQGGPQTNPTTASTTFSPRPLVETAQLPNLGSAGMLTSVPPTIVVPNWGNPFAGPRRYLPPNYQSTGYNVGGPQVATGYLPSGTVYPYPAASTVPTLNNSPQLPPPGFGASPRVNYQPVFKFQNMPPGTYLGQGAIGQPTAYVDGQPLRNLLRYVFP